MNLVADFDTGLFSVEGPMTDDGPWNLAAGRAREKQRRVVCGPAGTDRDTLADEFQQTHNVGGVPPGSIVRPRGLSGQLPAIVQPGALIRPSGTYIVPAPGWRYVEFFTANIRDPHTR